MGASALFLAACGGGNAPKKADPVYPIAVLDTGSAAVYTDYAAEIKSGTVVEIRPRVSGYIDKIVVQEGSRVAKGQVLIQINQSDLQEQYNTAVANADAARAQVDKALLEVRKLTPLVEKGIISPFELENANSSLNAARASLKAAESQRNNARINLDYARITSPVNGVVGRIVVREGTLVSPSDPSALTTVSGDGDVSAYFSIDENTILNMVDQSSKKLSLREKVAELPDVELLLSNRMLYDHKGELELASGLVDAATGSYQIKAVFPNPKGELRSGSAGVVRINRFYDGVLLVPQKATFERQDKKMVYAVDTAGLVRSLPITVDGISGSDYVVVGGVERGERIVLEGVDFIKEGQKIKTELKK